MPLPSREDINILLLEIVTGIGGGTIDDWAAVIGPVHHLPGANKARHSWDVIPGGSPRQRETVRKAVAVLRQTHPYVSADGTKPSPVRYRPRRRLPDS